MTDSNWQNIWSEMNKNPGLWKLSPITVLRARSLKIQKKRRQGHCGGKLTCVLLSNSINKIILISVMTINLSKMEISDSLIKFGLANVRSLKNKNQALLDYILEHQIDVFLVTETWLKQKMSSGSNVAVLIGIENHELCWQFEKHQMRRTCTNLW